MHKMSKESAANFAAIQSRLTNAEKILKTVLEDEENTSRQYLVALIRTYFNTRAIRKDNDEKKI